MAIRTTEGQVEGIIAVESDVDLTPFITAASALVDDIAADSGHTAERLELIERWLSAHFYTVYDPRPTEEKAGSIWAMYQSKVALNLSTSHYGQMAMVLDSSGLLRGLSEGKRVLSVTWLGKPMEDDDSDTAETMRALE